MALLIAVDGPVGAGKSSISDQVAQKLHILHLDTGAMYRAAGLHVLRLHIDPNDEQAAVKAILPADISARLCAGAQQTMLQGEDVSPLIRTQEVGDAASVISQYKPVREKMVALQQEISRTTDMLVDGRDIGTVVLPHADVKIFLTASPQVRAARRVAQLREKGEQPDKEEVLREVLARDERDTHRAVDPLRKAPDAVVVDSSALTQEETVDMILRIVGGKIHGENDCEA